VIKDTAREKKNQLSSNPFKCFSQHKTAQTATLRQTMHIENSQNSFSQKLFQLHSQVGEMKTTGTQQIIYL
jgi:hypothetical protein